MLLLLILLTKVVTMVLTLTSCNERTEISGAGGVFTSLFYLDTGNLYSTNRSAQLKQNIAFQYDVVNSAYGLMRIKNQISNSSRVNFGASQTPLSEADKRDYPTLVSFPVFAGAILIVFNLPGIDHIVMSLTVLADIYLGKIDYWNDARIQQYNKELLLPRQKIVPVARIDSTADTNVFTQALSSFSAEWEQNFGIFGGNESRWPSFIQYFAKKPIGLIGVVSSIPYTIGYSQQQNVVDAALNYVTLINQQNSIVQPTGQSIQSAINYWYSINNASENLNNANVSDAYPIVTYTYITIDSASVDLSCCSVRETVGWLISLLTYSEYLNKAAGYYFVHLNKDQTDEIVAKILKNITCGGENMFLAYMESLKIQSDKIDSQLILIPVCFILMGLLVAIAIRQRQKNLMMQKNWLLLSANLRLHIKVNSEENLRFPSIRGSFLEERVFVEVLKMPLIKHWNSSVESHISRVKRKLAHPNLMSFVGIVIDNSKLLGLYGSCPHPKCPKGTLHWVLTNNKFELSQTVKKNLLADVADGLAYLRNQEISLGSLNSLNCYLEQSWTVKISGWLNSSIYLAVDKQYKFELPKISNELTKSKLIELLYVDPELKKKSELNSSMDAYSFAMLVAEVFTGKIPYHNEVDLGYISYTSILNAKFHELHTRLPKMTSDVPVSIIQLITACLRPLASDRPPMTEIPSFIWGSGEARTGIVDSMMTNMESCMDQLQSLTARMQDLLHQMLPAKIADKLFQGQSVEPELFECVSIYFSDICGFTDISAHSTPAQVMGFLNDLWTLFDSVLEKFDAYKVDTIGDAYMVASGAPEKNGSRHVAEIAQLAIALLAETMKFNIPHMPNERLKIRIGLNSGPVIAGVIGKKMPQYCIFGDAVNTAARMESTSVPLRIQTSEKFADLLTEVDTTKVFKTELRGTIPIKVSR